MSGPIMSGPILVVGTMRSGSTLLRLVLDSHPAIAIGPESGFMGGVEAMRSIPGWTSGAGWYRRYGTSDAEFDRLLRALVDTVLGGYARANGKARWGDKTPFHTWHVRDMARIFPDGQFVGIVRHPAATLVSTRRWHYTPEDATSKWVRANAEIVRRAVELGPERFTIVRYEDLVLEPEHCLRGLLSFLHEPWDASVLDHARTQRRRGAPRTVEGGTRSDDPLDASRVGRWVGEITPDEQQLLKDRVPSELLRVLGYCLDSPRPAQRGPAPGGPLWPHDVDLSQLPDGKHATGDFDPERAAVHGDPQELAHRLLKAERRIAQLQAPLRVRWGARWRRVRAQPLRRSVQHLIRRLVRPVPGRAAR